MKKYGAILVIFILVATLGVGAKAYAQQKLSSTVISCMQDAVEKRDTSIISSVSTYSTAVTSALTVRKDAIKASWSLSTKEERDSARKAAWENYKTSAVQAKQDLKTGKSKAWDQFRIDRKACGVGITDTSTIDSSVL